MPENSNIQEVENKSRVELLLEAWAGGEAIELWEPQSNIERILMNILGATGIDINPIQSRNEALLLQILENGGGSGGGGSSDFHTATVTIINTATVDPVVFSAYFSQTEAIAYNNGKFDINSYAVTSDDPVALVYSAPFILELDEVDAGTTPTATGDCTIGYNEEYGYFFATVSGDCTISVVKNGN